VCFYEYGNELYVPCTWERAPVSEHRADFTQFLNQDIRYDSLDG
jgi:hypothetical protein